MGCSLCLHASPDSFLDSLTSLFHSVWVFSSESSVLANVGPWLATCILHWRMAFRSEYATAIGYTSVGVMVFSCNVYMLNLHGVTELR